MEDTMRIDFSNVEGQKTFDLLPDGKYVVAVTGCDEGKASEQAKNAGATLLNWEFTVEETIGGDTHVALSGDKEMKVEDRRVWDNVTLVEDSLWRLKALLDACGFDVSGEIDFDPQEVIGSRLVVKLGTQKARKDKVNGKEYSARNVVKSFHATDEGNENVPV